MALALELPRCSTSSVAPVSVTVAWGEMIAWASIEAVLPGWKRSPSKEGVRRKLRAWFLPEMLEYRGPMSGMRNAWSGAPHEFVPTEKLSSPTRSAAVSERWKRHPFCGCCVAPSVGVPTRSHVSRSEV